LPFIAAFNAQQIYRTDDKPLYRRGNRILLAITAYNIFLFIGAKIFDVSVNKKRVAKWDAMTLAEKDDCLSTPADQGSKRLDFRFAS
jgi:hypothetical protein